MNNQEFDKHFNNLIDNVDAILNNKGVEYRTNQDVFSNFVSLGKQLGLTEYQIWNVYFTKHITSINNAIKNNPENPDNESLNEPLKGRIVDAIAYLCLLYGMTKR